MKYIHPYCTYSSAQNATNVHRIYHDTAYGFPIESDDELYGRFILEINQAGLSWNLILTKEENFRNAFFNWDIDRIVKCKEKDIERLKNDAGIIRNRLKIDAAIHNARVIKSLQKEFGSFSKWLDHHHPLSKEEWVKLFKKTFKFTGSEIVNEFLMSSGYLPGAHSEDCPVYKKILKLNPKWLLK
jgi:DNA-3-methyladenine glycosylase I